MDHSLFDYVRLSCPRCQQTLSAKTWRILDTSARPDLVKRLNRGKLRRLVCLSCNKVAESLDVPLLLSRSDTEPKLIFSPAGKVDQTQSKQDSRQLLEHLRQSIGVVWQDSWISTGYFVPRIQLAEVLEGSFISLPTIENGLAEGFAL